MPLTRGRETLGLYVGIPFCRTICTYCDFNVYAHLSVLFESYVDALLAEIKQVSAGVAQPRFATSLAFGGGTPSILPADLIGRVIEGIHATFELQPGAEVTLEANPGTVDLDKLTRLRELGVNRLSLGVQTLDDARLKSFNRNHNSAASRDGYDLARKAGIDNVNIDLIFGLPDQTLDDWAKTLDEVIAWSPEHMSLYGLQVEAGTALARQIAKGRVRHPDPDLAADMFGLAEDRLGAAGFEHYEISNYAKRGFRSKHNSIYWLNRPYLGFGAGAHSYFRGVRYSNLLSPSDYVDRLLRGESVVATTEVISRDTEIGESLMLGLRLSEGIAFAEFRERFGCDVREMHGATISTMEDWGLMQVDESRMWLTRRGRLLSNQVLWRFLPDSEGL